MQDQRDYLDEGVLHLIYAFHESEADYGRIEADLNLVPKENRRLILLFEHALTLDGHAGGVAAISLRVHPSR